jgi:hypothetical protein
MNKTLSFLILLLAPAVAQAQDMQPWPDHIRQQFIASCMGKDQKLQAYCDCMAKGLEETIPLQELQMGGQRTVNNPKFEKILNTCTDQELY